MLGEKPALSTIMPQTSTRTNLVKLQIFLQTHCAVGQLFKDFSFQRNTKIKISKQTNKIRYSWFQYQVQKSLKTQSSPRFGKSKV